MITRFFFDIESQDLHKEGFSFGYVAVRINQKTNEFVILEQGECHSIEGAQGACDWVRENVIPALTALHPYLNADITTLDASILPDNVVRTTRELREKFYRLYKRYKDQHAEFWSDVNFPVETNFLSAIVKDGNGSRDFEMPYPLHDMANFLDVSVTRKNYCGLTGLIDHNPLHDALAILYSLQKVENELKTTAYKPPAITANQSKLRFVFDVGAQDLQLSGFGFGYVVTRLDEMGLQVLEQGQCYSIYSAQEVKEYVRKNSLPCLTLLHPFLNKDKEALEKLSLPHELVLTVHELRERFYTIYNRWRKFGAQVYSSDVNFPVETNFLSMVVEDGKGSRDWEMPYPLADISSLIKVDISREEYTGLQGLGKGNPLNHALASSCALHMHEIQNVVPVTADTKERIAAIQKKYQEHVQPYPRDDKMMPYVANVKNTGSPLDTKSKIDSESSKLQDCPGQTLRG